MAMSRECVMKALDAMEKGDHEAASKLLKEMVADAAAGDEPGSADRGGEGQAPPSPEKESSDVVDPKVVDNSLEDDDEKEEDDPKKKTERKAMRVLLRRTTNTQSFAEALSVIETWKVSHLTLEKKTAELARERAVLESAERRELVGKLVKCGAEFPSTVFSDDAATTIKPRWAKMPMADLRSHVTEQLAARKTAPGPGPQPPKGEPLPGGSSKAAPSREVVEYLAKFNNMSAAAVVALGLDASDYQICAETDCDLKVYAQLKAKRDGMKG